MINTLIRNTTVLIYVICLLSSCNSNKQSISILENGALDLTIISEGFIYNEASFPECHASSIVNLDDGTRLAAWFGGTKEKNPDVTIWLSRYDNNTWQPMIQVADGIQSAELRYPCWNPVLFNHSSGKLYLFYKVGPSPRQWWGEMKYSMDQGITWSDAEKLPDKYLGPIRAKPIELSDGRILCPSSLEYAEGPWKVHMELYQPETNEWQKTLVDHQSNFDVIQPTILRYSETQLQILCRSRQNKIIQAWSDNNGLSWGQLSTTDLPNPSAGIDGLTLDDGSQILVYNPTEDGPNDRSKLSVAFSRNGREWQEIYKLENQETGEYSYPAVIRSGKDRIDITYTWNRERIKHVVMKIE